MKSNSNLCQTPKLYEAEHAWGVNVPESVMDPEGTWGQAPLFYQDSIQKVVDMDKSSPLSRQVLNKYS